MGAPLRVGYFDPERRLDPAFVAALAQQRCTDLTVAQTEEEAAQLAELDVAFVGGSAEARAQVCDLLCSPTLPRRPYLVALLEEDSPTEVDLALEGGADDVLVPSRSGRLRVLLRHADRFRQKGVALQNPSSLLAQVSDFVLQVDTSGFITYMNRDARAVTATETLGTHATEHLPPASRPLFVHALSRALATGEPQTYHTASHGSSYRVRVVPFARDGELCGATLIATDITEISTVMARLEETRTEASAIVDALPDLVFRVSGAGRYLGVHAPRASELYVPAAEVIGRDVGDVLPSDVAEVLMAAVRRAIAGKTLEVVTYKLTRAGTTLDFEARIVSNGPDQAVAVVRNMTAYNQSRERLGLAERLASLGTMAAGVAHELNSPLTFVMLGLEWIERQLVLSAGADPASARLRERLREVQDGARRIQRIVRDLKGFTRPEESRATRIDVVSAIEGALSLAAAEVRYRATIERDYGDIPAISGNHARLGQVFLNLLVNAAHALPEVRSAANRIRIRSFLADDGRVAVEISDNGAGIPPEHLPRLFEPFFTTKSVGQGTGLGLWVCHEIVSELSGEIRVESEVGRGSTFRVLLPVGVVQDSLPPVHAPNPAPRRARILIIDDEPNLAKTLARLLDDHEVEIALGGAAALGLLEHAPAFDLVLCDLMMPGVTGMDVHATVKARAPEQAARFAFMTGGAFTPRAKEFLAAVGLPKLDKPFRITAVLDLLKRPERD